MFVRANILKAASLMVAIIVLAATLYSPWLILETRAQAACPQNNLAEGLVSAFGSISGLGNPDQICISGAPAYISTNQAKVRVDTYDQLFTRYYEQSKGNKVVMSSKDTSGNYRLTTANKTSVNSNTLYYAKGADLVVEDDAFVSDANSRLAIFFVDGDLYIPNDINYGQGNPRAGLVFVVKGQINIDSLQTTPQRIDAVLISEGGGLSGNTHSICTACNQDGQDNSRYIRGAGTYDPYLTINGGLVSLSSSNNIKLLRTPQDTSRPAETIIADPKYLVILKDTISTTIKIWSEI